MADAPAAVNPLRRRMIDDMTIRNLSLASTPPHKNHAFGGKTFSHLDSRFEKRFSQLQFSGRRRN